MRKILAIIIFWILYVPLGYAQSNPSSKLNPASEISQAEIDSIVKYIRTQFYQKNYDETIRLSPNAIEKAQDIGDLTAVYRLSSLMGNAFLQVGDTTQARRIFDRTIQNAEKVNDSTRNLTTARIDLGNIYALQEKHLEAIGHYKRALPLAERLQDTTHLFVLNYSIGNLYLEMENPSDAAYFVAQAKNYVSNLTAKAYKSVAKLVEGRLLFQTEKYTESANRLEESIQLAKESGYSDALIEGYEIMAKVQMALANYKYATEVLLEADIEKGKKYELDKIEAIEAEVAKYKVADYEQELEAQVLQNKIDQQETRRKTTMLWIQIAAGILLISAIFLFISYRKRKKLLVDLLVKNKQYLKAKEVSEEQVKAKTRLFANITHELRTPLYGIIGITSLLMEGDKKKPNSENLNALKFSAEYLLSLVNNVLQFTKINTAEKSNSKTRTFHLGDLIHNVVESAKFINKGHPNAYQVNMDPELPEYLIGEDVALAQVLMNVIGNASKFTHDGNITVAINCREKTKDQVRISFEICDTGIGIAKDRQKDIFNEFSVGGSSHENQGSGLGLPISKKLVEKLGGVLHLESELQKGTTVTFEIELKVATAEQTNQPPTYKANTLLKSKEILVVDDNRINLLVTQKTLQKYGATVHTALSGKAGIEIAQKTKLHLILMDINMPGMNGIEATHIIRSFNKTLPIVALTAVEKEKIILENVTTPLDDFIIKPYRQDVFLSTILKYVKREIYA